MQVPTNGESVDIRARAAVVQELESALRVLRLGEQVVPQDAAVVPVGVPVRILPIDFAVRIDDSD